MYEIVIDVIPYPTPLRAAIAKSYDEALEKLKMLRKRYPSNNMWIQPLKGADK